MSFPDLPPSLDLKRPQGIEGTGIAAASKVPRIDAVSLGNIENELANLENEVASLLGDGPPQGSSPSPAAPTLEIPRATAGVTAAGALEPGAVGSDVMVAFLKASFPNEGYSLLSRGPTSDGATVVIQHTVVSQAALEAAPAVAFTPQHDIAGQVQASAPIWLLRGKEGPEDPSTAARVGKYTGTVKNVTAAGNGFVECPLVSVDFGQEAYIYRKVLNLCALEEGDEIRFDVSTSEGTPQVSLPLWKKHVERQLPPAPPLVAPPMIPPGMPFAQGIATQPMAVQGIAQQPLAPQVMPATSPFAKQVGAPPVLPPPGTPSPGSTPQSLASQVLAPQGIALQGIAPQGVAPQGMPLDGMAPQSLPQQGMPSQGLVPGAAHVVMPATSPFAKQGPPPPVPLPPAAATMPAPMPPALPPAKAPPLPTLPSPPSQPPPPPPGGDDQDDGIKTPSDLDDDIQTPPDLPVAAGQAQVPDLAAVAARLQAQAQPVAVPPPPPPPDLAAIAPMQITAVSPPPVAPLVPLPLEQPLVPPVTWPQVGAQAQPTPALPFPPALPVPPLPLLPTDPDAVQVDWAAVSNQMKAQEEIAMLSAEANANIELVKAKLTGSDTTIMAQLAMGVVKQTFPDKGYSFLTLDPNNEKASVYVHNSICAPEVIDKAQAVLFKPHYTPTGEIQAEDPIWLLMGKVQPDTQVTWPDFNGLVSAILPSTGDGFVVSPIISEKYGRDAYIFRKVVKMCELEEGDEIQFNVHVNDRELPQVQAPVWKRHEEWKRHVDWEEEQKRAEQRELAKLREEQNTLDKPLGAAPIGAEAWLALQKQSEIAKGIAKGGGKRSIMTPGRLAALVEIENRKGKEKGKGKWKGDAEDGGKGKKGKKGKGKKGDAAYGEWHLVGQADLTQPVAWGQYTGTVARIIENTGDAFVKCWEVEQKYGRQAYIYRKVVQLCDLKAGDNIQFEVQENDKGMPQIQPPLWKRSRLPEGLDPAAAAMLIPGADGLLMATQLGTGGDLQMQLLMQQGGDAQAQALQLLQLGQEQTGPAGELADALNSIPKAVTLGVAGLGPPPLLDATLLSLTSPAGMTAPSPEGGGMVAPQAIMGLGSWT